MESSPELEMLWHKVKAVAQGPDGDLLRKLVDILYQRDEFPEEYDDEPLTPEDLAAIQRGEEDIKAGRITKWEDFKKAHKL